MKPVLMDAFVEFTYFNALGREIPLTIYLTDVIEGKREKRVFLEFFNFKASVNWDIIHRSDYIQHDI